MTTPFFCPDCGGRLFVDDTAETDSPIVRHGRIVRGQPLEIVRIRVTVAFCSACEFSLVIPDRARLGDR